MASCDGLALSPQVAKVPLLASPPRKRSPSRGEISLLNLLRARRMQYLARIHSHSRETSGEIASDKDNTMVIKGDYRIRRHNSDMVTNQLGPDSDTGNLARQIVKKAKSRIQKTRRRKSQPTFNEMSPLTSSINSSPSNIQFSPQTASALHMRRTLRLPPIESVNQVSSSSTNTSPDTSIQLNNTSSSKPCGSSPKCKRVLFTANNSQPFLTSVPISKPYSKEFLHPLPPRNRHTSTHSGQQQPKCCKRIVFLSEAHSPLCNDGSPSAPPATPHQDADHSVQYVPSLHDAKSQRTLKTRLDTMAKVYKEKQEQEVMHERYEQQRLQNYRIASLKAQQRAEIYALNKIMMNTEDTSFISNDNNKV